MFKKDADATLVKGKIIHLIKQKRALEPYRGGGTSIFHLTNTGNFNVNQIIGGLRKTYPKRSFTMFECRYFDINTEGYWLLELEPVLLHSTIRVETTKGDVTKEILFHLFHGKI